jgi:hypothetical protein
MPHTASRSWSPPESVAAVVGVERLAELDAIADDLRDLALVITAADDGGRRTPMPTSPPRWAEFVSIVFADPARRCRLGPPAAHRALEPSRSSMPIRKSATA